MTFEKKDLDFANYQWMDNEDKGNAQFFGEPSRRYFDPTNGNQMLFLINYVASILPSFSLRDAHTLESLIAERLPTDLKSEKSVFNWMVHSLHEANGELL